MIGRFFSSFYGNFIRPLLDVAFIVFAVIVAILIITAFFDARSKEERIRIIIVSIFFIIVCFVFL